MTRVVDTIDEDMIDVEECILWYYDCRPEQNWTVIEPTRIVTIKSLSFSPFFFLPKRPAQMIYFHKNEWCFPSDQRSQ